MALQSIGQVSKAQGISARMLRYYEQVGLIESHRCEDNDYRAYDEAAALRIQQIILLRKLQIPVKKIRVILDHPQAAAVIGIFKENIAGIEQEISALSAIKTILERFVLEIEQLTAVQLSLDFLQESSVQQLAESLSLVQKNVKETIGMTDLNKAAQVLRKLRNVRVIFLPPMTVASICIEGENAQDRAWQALTDFVKQSNLLASKPDVRVFKFVHANAAGKNCGGHEIWVSIPEDFTVPAPFVRKKFLGGQYAAHMAGDNGFETWLGLQDWVNESGAYQYDPGLDRCDPPMPEIDGFGGMRLDLDEVLNYYSTQEPPGDERTDLLLSIKEYKEAPEAPPVEIPGSQEKCGFRARALRKNKFRVLGFTQLMNADSRSPEGFEAELRADGRLDILSRFRKPGAPLLRYDSHDMDSQMQGGWRSTFCLAESDITDLQAFMEHSPYTETIDASGWLVFEYARGDDFDDHAVCMKLGYTWNGCVSGTFPKIWLDAEAETLYGWYPIK